MRVTVSSLQLEGALLEGENPLPMFRDRNYDRPVKTNESLTAAFKHKLGYETGARYLPYRMQDRFSRARGPIALKTIVLANDVLEAVFLPEYGGRLYALKDKRTGKDLLYKNTVFQPANLAILNAWFSGGIEWNIGQFGHTFATCSPLHAAKLTDPDGNEFLRIYEYERCKNVFWHIDFHLPQGSDKLFAHVRIVNDNEAPVPMYWWTNIAVRETDQTRVFSSAAEVIHMDHLQGGFGLGRLPHLPTMPDIDASYPMGIPFSNEYFFQTPEAERAPWQAVVYEDGGMFYERSTAMLRYRKMFCWGNHIGGRRWCDYLSKPGEGDYLEIQGGLAPTQLHGLDMPAKETWSFTQTFGAAAVDSDAAYQADWSDARDTIAAYVDRQISDRELDAMHDKLGALAGNTPDASLHVGSGWGALERMRRRAAGERGIPAGFVFGDETLRDAQHPWIALLREGRLPEADSQAIPSSWMVQPEWADLLARSLAAADNETWTGWMHLGVMQYEKGLEEEAVLAWERSLALRPSAWVYRNLAVVMTRRGKSEEAVALMERAHALHQGFPDQAFAEEYLALLMHKDAYGEAWRIYASLPEAQRNQERIRLIVGPAALALNEDAFVQSLFEAEFAVIREGELRVVDLWYAYQAKRLARERNTEVTDDLMREAKRSYPPPAHIDFRLAGN